MIFIKRGRKNEKKQFMSNVLYNEMPNLLNISEYYFHKMAKDAEAFFIYYK